MTTSIKTTDAKQTKSTEIIDYEMVYYVDCTNCTYKEMAITFDQAYELKKDHDDLDHSKIQTVEVLQIILKDIFRPDQYFTYEKYLLYQTKTQELQPFGSTSRCSCTVCDVCWNPTASISLFEDGVFEKVSLTFNCLDCFVICNDRKKGW